MLIRLQYISHSSAGLTKAEVDELVRQADAKNAAKDITGVLIYSDPYFFQVLEGPHQEVMDLYSKIASDERHKQIRTLDLETDIGERYFEGWGMRYVQANAEGVGGRRPLSCMIDVLGQERHALQSAMDAVQAQVLPGFNWQPGSRLGRTG